MQIRPVANVIRNGFVTAVIQHIQTEVPEGLFPQRNKTTPQIIPAVIVDDKNRVLSQLTPKVIKDGITGGL